MCFDASNFGEFTDASVFYWFSLLLKTIANTIIKAIAICFFSFPMFNSLQQKIRKSNSFLEFLFFLFAILLSCKILLTKAPI